MRTVFVADARSPIARNWISYFIQQGHEVHVISTYPCPSSLPAASLHVVPVAFSGLAGMHHDGGVRDDNRVWSLLAPLLSYLRSGWGAQIFMGARHWLAPLDVYRHVRRVRTLVQSIAPDLVHTMRIPFEGILAALAIEDVPLLVSVWGNDFTLHASQYPPVGRLTRQVLRRADALHCDCQRDIRLACAWGFSKEKPSIVLPGAGGIQPNLFHPGLQSQSLVAQLSISAGVPIVFYPRRFRPGSVRTDVFFESIPLVLRNRSDTVFVCVGMVGNTLVENWLDRLQVRHAVRLLPEVSRAQMADLFRLAHVTVSPGEHDGTPNTLLEAMACGCFPVAGDIESVREWIIDGVNGLLCDPASPKSLAQAVVRAIEDVELRTKAARYNRQLILERADYDKVMARAEAFYREVIAYFWKAKA